MAARGGEAEEGEEACAEFGGVEDCEGRDFEDIDVAFRCAGDEVCAGGGPDGRGSGLFGFGGEDVVSQGCRGDSVLEGDRGIDVDEKG